MKRLFAVEISGACNFDSNGKCPQCPMTMRPRYRPRGFMSMDTAKKALAFSRKVERHNPLSLHNFGEPLLHPDFFAIAHMFADEGPVSVSTNGSLIDELMADRLAEIAWESVCVSFWDGQSFMRAIELLAERGVKYSCNEGTTHDFAGTAPGGVKNARLFAGCQYLNQEKGVIWWDGRVAPCCITDRDGDAIGTIDQEPSTIAVSAFELCKKCHHYIPEP